MSSELPQPVPPDEGVDSPPAALEEVSAEKPPKPDPPTLATRSGLLLKSTAESVVGLGKAAGSSITRAGKTIAQLSMNAGSAIARTASQAGAGVGNATTSLGKTAYHQTHLLVEKGTEDAGRAVTFVGDSPLIRKLTGALKLDWLVGMSDQVDLVKATEAVRKLQQEYPDESSSQIAHRVMVEKAVYAGGVGLASSLVPGQAIAMLAVDLATTTALQTEMLYQIAAAYGLDLQDPARKGEVIAIFGLALGGSRAVRAGLGFVKNVPLAGAVIGASANATILYSLGYAACRYYEAKLDPDVAENSTETLEVIRQRSETYLEVARAQEAILDQILVHMILASYPETAWEDIQPSLQSLELPPTSLAVIAEHLKAPQPLGALLDQLNQDFAVLALSRCYAIAQLDGEINANESEVLAALSEKFDIDLQKIAASVAAQTPIDS